MLHQTIQIYLKIRILSIRIFRFCISIYGIIRIKSVFISHSSGMPSPSESTGAERPAIDNSVPGRIACVFGAIDKSGFISFSGESCRSFPGVGNDTFVYFITIITATCIIHHLFISLVSRISSDYSKIKRFFQTDRFFGIFCPEEIYFSSFFNWA